MNDPLVKAIHGLVDHSAATDSALEWLDRAAEALGGECRARQGTDDHFDPARLNKMWIELAAYS